MGKVIVDMSVSLDGYSAGLNPCRERPLGEHGERLHRWIFGAGSATDQQMLDEIVAAAGAVLVGKRTYADAIDDAWGGVTPFHAPAFVVTHEAPVKRVEGFTYVTEGIESALAQARRAAGFKSVWVMGGARLAQQYLCAGMVDEVRLHQVPVLLGRGVRLFDQLSNTPHDLHCTDVIEGTGATHLIYRVAG